jgi:hypothetical protein
MANLPPPANPPGVEPALAIGGQGPGDPAAVAAEAIAAAAAAGEAGGGMGGEPPFVEGAPPGVPPPPPVIIPLASPGPIARAIWAKVPELLRDSHARTEMSNYLALLNGPTHNPEALALAVTTASFEPKCFLTARENSMTAIPEISLAIFDSRSARTRTGNSTCERRTDRDKIGTVRTCPRI